MSRGRLTSRQVMRLRVVQMTRHIKRGGRVWILCIRINQFLKNQRKYVWVEEKFT